LQVLGLGNWYDAPQWVVKNGEPTWFGITVPFDAPTLLGVWFVSMAIAEGLRNDNQGGVEKRCYPGGAFDPLGFSKDPKTFEDKKLKELK
jgi:light-harvesting complex I chlorophyll a/b binding protein 1